MIDTEIPKDAREIYCNEKGEPIAYCPKDSMGLTDVKRAEFYLLNEERLSKLAKRAQEKATETGVEQGVICIDVDDPTWMPIVDTLLPGHDWESYRVCGERPVARGVVPRALLEETVKFYPAAEDLATDRVNILVLAAGGIAVIPHQ